jgi:protein-disulfide isomerase
MIRFLLALLFNQFTIALRRRSFVGSQSDNRQVRTMGKGRQGVGGAMVEMPAVPFAPIQCNVCWGTPNRGSFRRIVATTKLERFLQTHQWRIPTILHACDHIQERYGFEQIDTAQLLEIRKGNHAATAAQQQLIALAVSNLLGEIVPPSMLFDDATVVEFSDARRQA